MQTGGCGVTWERRPSWSESCPTCLNEWDFDSPGEADKAWDQWQKRIQSDQRGPKTLTQAAALLGVTAASLRQQIPNGKVKARKVGRDWTVTEREVERYRRESRRVVACVHDWMLEGTIGESWKYCRLCGERRPHVETRHRI